MSAQVIYNSEQLVPAPFVSISTSSERLGNYSSENTVYTISINGYILAQKGSPNSSGVFGDFGSDVCESIPESGWTDSILNKFCAIQNLFKDDYKTLNIGNEAGLDNITCYPRLISSNLDTSDRNPQYAQYSIELEADNIYCGSVPFVSGDNYIKSYDESWDFSYDRTNVTSELGDNRIFSVTHSISANGKPQISGNAIVRTPVESAKDFVCSRMSGGNDITMPENCILPSAYMVDSYIKKNYFDSHSMSITDGSYSVTESWIYTSGDTSETYSISHDSSISSGCDTVGISGTITGYDQRIDGSVVYSAFSKAQAKFNSLVSSSAFKDRAETVSGLVLDTNTESSTIGYNSFTGAVDYSYSFKQRPTKMVSSAKYESIKLTNNWNEDIVVVTTILDKGELVRKINTSGYKAPSSTLNMELVFGCDASGMHKLGPRFTTAISDEIQSVVDYYHPSGLELFENIYVESQNEDWDRSGGIYSYSVSWRMNYAGLCG